MSGVGRGVRERARRLSVGARHTSCLRPLRPDPPEDPGHVTLPAALRRHVRHRRPLGGSPGRRAARRDHRCAGVLAPGDARPARDRRGTARLRPDPRLRARRRGGAGVGEERRVAVEVVSRKAARVRPEGRGRPARQGGGRFGGGARRLRIRLGRRARGGLAPRRARRNECRQAQPNRQGRAGARRAGSAAASVAARGRPGARRDERAREEQYRPSPERFRPGRRRSGRGRLGRRNARRREAHDPSGRRRGRAARRRPDAFGRAAGGLPGTQVPSRRRERRPRRRRLGTAGGAASSPRTR